ncbi:MAG: hypothetical protein ABIT16_04480 [Croceibacterium sp.]
MKDVLDIFFEIVVAIFGAVFFSALTVALGALAIGCAVFGSCWTFLGWRKKRAARLRKPD